MNKTKIKIAQVTLQILKKTSWDDVKVKEVKNIVQIKNFDKFIKNKKDFLRYINQYFDYKLSMNSKSIEQSNNKDMIFEVLMMRFDLLQTYRKEILSIYKSFKKKPQNLVFLLPSILDSIILMMGFTNISPKGLLGRVKIKGIFIIYVASFFIWVKDESKSLEKTMTSLDNNLDQAGKLLKFLP